MTGAQLKAWRTARKLSQEAAADQLGVSPKSLRAYEAGEVPRVVRLAVLGWEVENAKAVAEA